MVIDFNKKRQAVARRKRETFAEFLAENERDHKVTEAFYECEDRLRREREQWEKYELAMAEKRALAGLRLVLKALSADDEGPADDVA